MATSYNSVNVKCPFYITDDSKSITCEGFKTGCDTRNRFKNKNNKDVHMEEHCQKDYKKCGIYKLASEKYKK